MPTRGELRDALESTLPGTSWFTPASLAKRWNVSSKTVRKIPRERLPYREFGVGEHPRRRYKPEWVYAYENSGQQAA